MGFEPTIFAVTGRRALQAAPRGRIDFSSSGGSRTHSIPGSKPRWSASCLPSHVAPRARVELANARDQRCASVPDSNQRSSPCKGAAFAARPRDQNAEAVGLEPTISIHRDTCFRDRLLIQPDDFQSSIAKKFRGLESNQRPPGSEPGIAYQQRRPRNVVNQTPRTTAFALHPR